MLKPPGFLHVVPAGMILFPVCFSSFCPKPSRQDIHHHPPHQPPVCSRVRHGLNAHHAVLTKTVYSLFQKLSWAWLFGTIRINGKFLFTFQIQHGYIFLRWNQDVTFNFLSV